MFLYVIKTRRSTTAQLGNVNQQCMTWTGEFTKETGNLHHIWLTFITWWQLISHIQNSEHFSSQRTICNFFNLYWIYQHNLHKAPHARKQISYIMQCDFFTANPLNQPTKLQRFVLNKVYTCYSHLQYEPWGWAPSSHTKNNPVRIPCPRRLAYIGML
jgi:hypothetical protein